MPNIFCAEKNVSWVFIIYTSSFVVLMALSLLLSQTSPCFYVSAVLVFFENIVGKGEIVRDEQFLLFFPFGELTPIYINFKCVVCKPFQFGRVEILSIMKGLMSTFAKLMNDCSISEVC